ncbi:MAG: hypothetical protein GY847_33330 [Proteobacteria bacterium]|nr:hypothetical protein [Pseudomonadota bacterium]
MFSRNSVILILLFSLSIMGSYLINLKTLFEKCFENRIASVAEPIKTKRKPLTDRVVMVVFDDVAYDTASRNLPLLKKRAEEKGIFSRVNLDRFTFTIAGVYTLGTGDQPSLIQIKDEFLSQESEANNIFHNVKLMGGNTAHFGESLWLDMYGKGIDDFFTRRDLGPYIEYGSDEMIDRLRTALENKENRLIVIHLGEVGHVSHRVGVYGTKLSNLLNRLDKVFLEITSKHKDKTTWLITSDHGTTLEGQHGGVTKSERTTFLGAWGPGIAKKKTDTIAQVEYTNIISMLLGVPFTTQSCGLLPDVFVSDDPEVFKIANAELLSQKQQLYDKLEEQYGGAETVDKTNISSLKKGIEQIKFGASSPLVLGGYVLVLLALISLWALQLKGGVTQPFAAVSVFVLVLTFALPAEFVWICLLLLVPIIAFRLRHFSGKLLTGGAIISMTAIVLTALFFMFPSKIYLAQWQTVRFVVLIGALTITLIGFLLVALVSFSKPSSGGYLRLALWGVAAAYVIATPARYYQYLIPVGFVLLAGSQAFHTAKSKRGFLVRFAKMLPILSVLLFFGYSQIADLGLPTFRDYPEIIRSSNLATELVLAAGLVLFVYWLNTHYQGIVKPVLRWISVSLVWLLHISYHMQLIGSNLPLVLLFVFVISWQIWFLRQDSRAKMHWYVMIILTIMTQQQNAIELTLAVAGTLVFRWIALKNPYKKDGYSSYAFLAFAVIVYGVYFLAIKGHLFRPSYVMVFTGFLGYNMPMILHLSATLVCFYYLQPLILAWTIARATGVDLPPFHRAGVIAASILFLQAVFTCALFSFSVLPSGTYIQGATGSILLLNYGLGSLLAAACSLILWRRALRG